MCIRIFLHQWHTETQKSTETFTIAYPTVVLSLTNYYCISCKTKCKLYETFIRKPTSVNKQNYITFRNKLSQTIRNAKQTYYFDLFTKSNIKKTWSYINTILKGDKTKHTPSNILMNDKLITNSKDICDCFISSFTNLGTNRSKGIPRTTNPLNYVYFRHHSLFLLQLTNLKSKKSLPT